MFRTRFNQNNSSSKKELISVSYTWDELLNFYLYAKESEGLSKVTLSNKKEAMKLLNKFFKHENHMIPT
ncbi:hypothetical protein AMD01_03830 [Priestia koreensis]|uniref:Uncharacterized protein n=1 Tax=Priestia koreensis TaxID=284581 RepID=A0A0M0LIQ8_9BACI|nr:hypothetical protein AMD01_03830 [Priestia koreensis]